LVFFFRATESGRDVAGSRQPPAAVKNTGKPVSGLVVVQTGGLLGRFVVRPALIAIVVMIENDAFGFEDVDDMLQFA
jgi:hypothetical protein